MSYQEELEQSSLDLAFPREQRNGKAAARDSDTSLIDGARYSAIVNTEDVTERKFREDFVSVGKNLRKYVKLILRRPDGITILREVIKDASSVNVDTLNATEQESSNDKGVDMPGTEQRIEGRSLKPVTSETLPSLSGQQLESYDAETSASLSLIDSSIKLLHGSMKKMLEPELENPERKPVIETFTVGAAVKCADSIGKLMKVKLEAIRLAKDLRDE